MAHTIQYQKTNNTIKMGMKPEQMCFQTRYTDGQHAHEKMFNSSNHQRTLMKSTMRYHLMPVRMSITKKPTNNKCWQGYKKKDPQYTVVGM